MENRENTIKKVWFSEGRIHIATGSGKTMSRPLEAFPTLKDATAEQRNAFEIGFLGDDIRWPELDEDIHIDSFRRNDEPEPDNSIGELFRRFPQLNVSEMAKMMGIHKSLLARYIYGIKKPSDKRREEIFEAVRALGKKLSEI